MPITLTDALRQHAKEHYHVAADAADEVIQKAVGDHLATGELPAEEYARLAHAKAPKIHDLIAASVEAALAKHLTTANAAPAPAPAPATQPGVRAEPPVRTGDQPSPQKLYAQSARLTTDPSSIRVKEAVEQYDGTRKRALYPTRSYNDVPNPMAGRPVEHAGEAFDDLSERDKAIAGAWFKMSLFKSTPAHIMPAKLRPTEHDIQLVNWAIENSKWTGFAAPEDACGDTDADDPRVVSRRKLTDSQKYWVKTLLDDTVSGGIEIAPIEFDNAVITVPVLYGELYPYVNVVTVTRGRRMKGGSLVNPTFTWGIPEGTSITPFNTQSMIAAFDTPIYNIVSAILIGLDFLEDSPTTIGDIIVKKYGEKFMEQLDYVIAMGDGVTQPLGIFNTASPTTISSDNSANGPPTVADYEGLYFAVQKQFRNEAGGKPAFVGSDTSYQRARSIAVSPTDERRVFGMDHQNYMLLNVPYRVQNNIVNNKIAFAMLNRYRMYRRLGMTVRMETAGQTLALANERLITVRGRMGGQMELGGAISIVTNAQT